MKKSLLEITATIFLLGAAPIQAPRTPRPPAGTNNPAEREKKPAAEVGEEAPLFELVDQFGKTHKLEDYNDSIVVLEWFNETCPYCVAVWKSGLVEKLIADLGEVDTPVVYLSINSTANRPEDEVLESGKEFIEDAELEVPMLMDYDGKVGRSYAARTTPHMFVIDTEGVLIYQGAISDDLRGKEGDKAETHVLRAVQQTVAGQEVTPSYVKPWGCSVKYAKKDGDDRRMRPRRPKNPRD